MRPANPLAPAPSRGRSPIASSGLLPADHAEATARRLARSVLAGDGSGEGSGAADGFHRWFRERARHSGNDVRRVPLDGLEGWRRDPRTGDIGHESGRFFTVGGLDVRLPGGPVPHWTQPVIHQPEVGILGFLVKEFDGVPHFLVQAKVEPGNANGLQLSPTVQATRSNYTGVHRGRAVPYLDHFRAPPPGRVITDVYQSEQGAWFFRKHNRNMVVETSGDVEVLDGFRWMTLGELHRLLSVDDLVNMDARTVLSCLPLSGAGLEEAAAGDPFRTALARSGRRDAGSLDDFAAIQSWITEARTSAGLTAEPIPLDAVRDWRRTPERISHPSGRFFSIIGVGVRARGREVGAWMQPLLQPHGTGVIGLLVADIDGVLHALMQVQAEPGLLDTVELAPTVQCTPRNYEILPARARPPYLDRILDAAPEQIRYDTILSEEGGRFYHARNRYVIVETAPFAPDDPAYRWLSLRQLADLVQHPRYLNVQARSILACLRSLLQKRQAGTDTGRTR